MSRTTPDVLATQQGELTAIRRDIHRHPETAFEEQRTSRIVADKLTSVVTRLRDMSPLYELAKEGVDLSTMVWQTEGH